MDIYPSSFTLVLDFIEVACRRARSWKALGLMAGGLNHLFLFSYAAGVCVEYMGWYGLMPVGSFRRALNESVPFIALYGLGC